MYKLKLIKGRSYTGCVKAANIKPFVLTNDKLIADKAVKSGYFELVETIEKPDVKAVKTEEKTDNDKKQKKAETVPDFESKV
jgi:hypothetical protein